MRKYLLLASLAAICAGPLTAQTCTVTNDVNGNEVFDFDDPKFLFVYLFANGDDPVCPNQTDANGDGSVNIADVATMAELAACDAAIVGDVNGSGALAQADVEYLLDYLFVGGPEPVPCLEVADVNGDGSTTVGDAVTLLSILPCPPAVVGDANGDENPQPDIADLTVVARSFTGGPGPVPCPLAGDLNEDGQFDIADLIAYLDLFD